MTATKFKRERFEFNGDVRFRCTNCGQIKKINQFNVQNRSRWGMSPQCKVCISNYRESMKTPQKQKARKKQSRSLARKRAKISKRADVAYENWLFRQEQGLKVQLGKHGWSKHSDCCIGCGTFFHPHHAKGYCLLCYHRQYNGSKAHEFHRRGKWSSVYDACIECGNTDSPHGAKGVCKRCLWYNHNGKKPQGPCVRCGAEIPPSKYAAKRRYCTDTCARRGYWERRRQREAGKALDGQASLPLSV